MKLFWVRVEIGLVHFRTSTYESLTLLSSSECTLRHLFGRNSQKYTLLHFQPGQAPSGDCLSQ